MRLGGRRPVHSLGGFPAEGSSTLTPSATAATIYLLLPPPPLPAGIVEVSVQAVCHPWVSFKLRDWLRALHWLAWSPMG